MRRVLVTGAANIGKAGVATIVYKWGQNFTGEVVYDYLMQRGLPDKSFVDNIKSKGSRIYTMNKDSFSLLQVIGWIEKIVRENNYDTIHINTDSAYIAAAYIFASKRGGIENIFVHSHCTRIDDNRPLARVLKTSLHYLCRPYVRWNTKRYLACAEPACKWMFGEKQAKSEKYIFIENGVEPDTYTYNRAYRDKLRKDLGIDGDQIVVGNVGRFSFQKNHDRLIDVFSEYHKHHENSKLLLVGEGELEDRIKIKVKECKLDQEVYFLGSCSNVNELLSAMDVMVMPSRFEGLPVTAVEAQMASLPCVLSSTITKEAKFTPYVLFADFDKMTEVISQMEKATEYQRPYDSNILNASLFNVVNAARKLEKVLVG